MSSGGPSNHHGAARRVYFRRHKPDRDQTASSNLPARSEARDARARLPTRGGRTEAAKPRADDTADNPSAEFMHLDMKLFLALPLSVMAQVCTYLQFQDMTTLSRTSPDLRRLFMNKISKRCWDAARWLQDMPEWIGIAAPRAAAFIFDDACQGEGCQNSAKLRTFYVAKRYCPSCAPTYLPSWNSAAEKSPRVRQEMVYRLPWTRNRAANNDGGIETGRFVLSEDVERLRNRILQIGTVYSQAGMRQLDQQLKESWKVSQMVAQRMEAWTRSYESRIWHAKNKRFTEFLHGLQKRWGWNMDRLPAVRDSPRFDALIDFAQNAPKLDKKVWDRAEAVIRSIIEEDARSKPPEHRTWSFSIPQTLQRYPRTPVASSSKGNRR